MKRRAALALILLTALAGCGRQQAEPTPPEPTGPAPVEPDEVEPTTVTLWFPEQDLAFLEAELRDLPTQPDQPEVLAKAVAEAVLAGPTEPGHVRPGPPGVKVRGVELAAGLATVDLSGDFVERFSGGSKVAELAVYSLVNSLAELDGVDQVRLCFDGRPGGEFAGVLDLSKPLAPAPELNSAATLDADEIDLAPPAEETETP